MDATRKYVLDRSRELGTNLKSLSRQVGRNDSYLQQFVEYGKPRRLPEEVRSRLAELLDVNETLLGAPAKKILESGGTDTDREFFMLKEIALLAGAAYGGGIDEAEWNIPEGKGVVRGHKPAAHWGMPASYAKQELGLKAGRADILTVRGDSMDDGTKYGLSSGDKAVIDLTDTDPGQGAIFAVWDGHTVIIKQVEVTRGSDPVEIVCSSRNDRYRPIPVLLDGNAHIIGRVVAKISRM